METLLYLFLHNCTELETMRQKPHLSDEPVEIFVRRHVDVQVPAANVVDCLVVHHEGAVGVLERCVSGQHRVVRLHDGGGNLNKSFQSLKY